jgi:hypothetical protein
MIYNYLIVENIQAIFNHKIIKNFLYALSN